MQKSSSQEQLGLTVSYIHCAAGSGGSVCGGGVGGGGSNSGGNNSVKSINEVDSEASTEVYISNILPDSLAARDGRLRQGDQILQVSEQRMTSMSDDSLDRGRHCQWDACRHRVSCNGMQIMRGSVCRCCC